MSNTKSELIVSRKLILTGSWFGLTIVLKASNGFFFFCNEIKFWFLRRTHFYDFNFEIKSNESHSFHYTRVINLI